MAERWQTSEARTAAAFWRDATGLPVTGLTPTGSAQHKDGTAGAPAVTVAEITVGGALGFYRVSFASAPTKDVVVRLDGGASLTSTRYVALEVPVGGYVDLLDAAISVLTGRLTSTRAALLDNLDATVSSVGSGVTTLLARITSARAVLLDNLDVAVSTRATHAEATADSTGVTTLLARLTGTRALLLDLLSNLDAAVSTRARPVDVQTTVINSAPRGEVGP